MKKMSCSNQKKNEKVHKKIFRKTFFNFRKKNCKKLRNENIVSGIPSLFLCAQY